MNKAVELHKQGYNCAESIIKALNDENGLDIPISAASPFGGGMTVGATCGAITGALIAIGTLKGRKSNEEANETRSLTKKVMNKVKEKYGTYECIELKKQKVSCAEIIEYTYGVLKDSLKD